MTVSAAEDGQEADRLRSFEYRPFRQVVKSNEAVQTHAEVC